VSGVGVSERECIDQGAVSGSLGLGKGLCSRRAYLEPPKRYILDCVSAGSGFIVGIGKVWEMA
jgi:hypothetical protein